MKSIIRKGNDGILCTAHILCALSMKLKERNLQKEEEILQSFEGVKQVSNMGQGEWMVTQV